VRGAWFDSGEIRSGGIEGRECAPHDCGAVRIISACVRVMAQSRGTYRLLYKAMRLARLSPSFDRLNDPSPSRKALPSRDRSNYRSRFPYVP
jgi:hypothetical protein